MKKISYSKDVDVLMISFSDRAIAYAEDEGEIILHYSEDAQLVLIEILNFCRLISDETVKALIAT